MSDVIVIGTGAHTKSIIAAAEHAGMVVRGVYDDDSARWGQSLLGVPIVGATTQAIEAGLPAVLAFDSPKQRQAMAALLKLEWATIVHPSAFVNPTVPLGPGSVILEGVIVQPGCAIGQHVIVGANATVAHDCTLEDFAQLSPGVDLAGGVRVGRGACLETGAAAIPNTRIGAWAEVGPRAVVIRDVADHASAWGVPARAESREPPQPAGDPWLSVQRVLVAWVFTGAAMTGLGYLIARFGLFLRQLDVTNDGLDMHPMHMSLWIGVVFIALGVGVNLFVPFEQSRLAQRLKPQDTRDRARLSFASVLSVVLALVGVGMAAYLFDARHFPS
ncbi:MAG: NeuD/PglB/VioB family sugar acetyltransferase [Planctomycetia bacterium]|nr:NeuD/PglB/VioB family sugar acetyltransferase [Planctomycetia bacterium]